MKTYQHPVHGKMQEIDEDHLPDGYVECDGCGEYSPCPVVDEKGTQCPACHIQMDEVKLALEMNKLVHNECKDVPHDIGLKLLEVVKKHVGEQLNIPTIISNTCDEIFEQASKVD